MANFSQILKGLGKGARAVGRGAMKGVLGFDDRDIFNRKPKIYMDNYSPMETEETAGKIQDIKDEMNPEYSGYSRGKADVSMLPEDPEAAAAGVMEDPPELDMSGGSPTMDLEMPKLPGMRRKAEMGSMKRKEKPQAENGAVPGLTGPSAMRASDKPPSLPMGLSAPGAGMILDSESSNLDKVKRSLSGGGPDAVQRYEHEKENPNGVNEMKMPWYSMLFAPTGGKAAMEGETKMLPEVMGKGGAQIGGVDRLKLAGSSNLPGPSFRPKPPSVTLEESKMLPGRGMKQLEESEFSNVPMLPSRIRGIGKKP